MTSPCPKCGLIQKVDDIEPIGIHMDVLVAWNCPPPCGTTRCLYPTKDQFARAEEAGRRREGTCR